MLWQVQPVHIDWDNDPDWAVPPIVADVSCGTMALTVQKDGLRERDLSAHLSNSRAAPASKPLEVVRYQLSSAEREEMRDRGGDIEDQFQMDFPIKFGRDLAQRLPAVSGVRRTAGGLGELPQRLLIDRHR